MTRRRAASPSRPSNSPRSSPSRSDDRRSSRDKRGGSPQARPARYPAPEGRRSFLCTLQLGQVAIADRPDEQTLDQLVEAFDARDNRFRREVALPFAEVVEVEQVGGRFDQPMADRQLTVFLAEPHLAEAAEQVAAE